MRHARIAMPTAPPVNPDISRGRDHDRGGPRSPLFPPPPAASGWTVTWILSLLAAALVVAALGYGLSLTYPSVFKA